MLVPLKIAILQNGSRQYKIAAAVNIDPARLSRIINGISEASEEERQAIAKYLGEPETKLFGEPKLASLPPLLGERKRSRKLLRFFDENAAPRFTDIADEYGCFCHGKGCVDCIPELSDPHDAMDQVR